MRRQENLLAMNIENLLAVFMLSFCAYLIIGNAIVWPRDRFAKLWHRRSQSVPPAWRPDWIPLRGQNVQPLSQLP